MTSERMSSEICVSILCTAYNHDKYLRDTLEGFIKQRTNFKYEVLVNDDVSTDGTIKIIKEYAEKYPDIIKPIYQVENQYSKGRSIVRNILLPLSKGRYIALCEGDDFWIDPLKLQKQFDYMESHPDCTFCFTNGLMGNSVKKIKPRVFIPCKEYKKKWKCFRHYENFNFVELLELGFIPTASFFCRRRDFIALPFLSPNAFQGDEYFKLYLTSLGYAHFINDKTCFYSIGVDNSASVLWFRNKENQVKYKRRFISLYEEIDELTHRQYTQALSKAVLRYRLGIAILEGNVKEIRSSKYRDIIKDRGMFHTLQYYLLCLTSFIPFGKQIIEILRKLRCAKKFKK